MSFSLLGKIASEHVASVQKQAGGPSAKAPVQRPVTNQAPARPAASNTHHIYDNMGKTLRNNPKKPHVTQEEWVPHWPKGKAIGTGP